MRVPRGSRGVWAGHALYSWTLAPGAKLTFPPLVYFISFPHGRLWTFGTCWCQKSEICLTANFNGDLTLLAINGPKVTAVGVPGLRPGHFYGSFGPKFCPKIWSKMGQVLDPFGRAWSRRRRCSVKKVFKKALLRHFRKPWSYRRHWAAKIPVKIWSKFGPDFDINLRHFDANFNQKSAQNWADFWIPFLTGLGRAGDAARSKRSCRDPFASPGTI